MIDCREAVRRMWAYLDHSLEARPTGEVEAHLEVCRRCCGELGFSRALRGLVAGSSGPPLPGDVRDRIEQLLGTGPDSGQDR